MNVNKQEGCSKMKAIIVRLTKAKYVLAALVLAAVAAMPLATRHAYAAQVTSRSIEMSDSNPGDSGVTYNVQFTPGTSTTIGGIVVDICANDPIIGDTSCTFPTGFSWASSPTLAGGFTGMGTGWTASGVQAGAGAGATQVLELSNATPQSVSTGTPVNFQITSVTNPTTANLAFYARILTFDTSAHMTAQYTTSTTTRASTFANNVDYGGVAISTGTGISITAKVMETITFCVSGAAPTAGCGGTTAPTLTIGHGTNNILDSTAVDTKNAFSQISTNAQGGITIRMKSGNSCSNGGLSTNGGSTCNIPGVGATAAAITAGTAKFGMYVTPASGNTVASAPYNGGTTTYGMDNSSGTAVTTTYGSPVVTTSGPVNSENDTYTFGATAANTTQAGIYTVTEQLIATGVF